MDTTGTPGNFNLHDLFKFSPQSGFTQPGPIPSSAPSALNQSSASTSYSNPFHQSPSNGMPSLNPYESTSSLGLTGFAPQISTTNNNQQYSQYHLDQQTLWPSYQSHGLSQSQAPQIPSPSITSSVPLPNSTNVLRPLSPSVDSDPWREFFNLQGTSIPSSQHSTSNVAIPSAPPMSLAPNSASRRSNNSTLPQGRHLKGEHIVYDIDVRLPGESQPQLAVSPITMYTSDPTPLAGRQIAVNKSYICYGLRANRNIRILNIHTGLKCLLFGHSERVTDMAFFNEDVHLLASASSDGRVYVRKIEEGRAQDGELQIMDQIILAVQFMGSWKSVHPHVCWLNHTQDVLIVGVSKFVFYVDIPKVRQNAPPNGFTTDDLVFCDVDNPIEGFHSTVYHDGDITCLSSSHWPLLASASKDGRIRIWKHQDKSPVSVLVPYEGQEVGAFAFLSKSHRPDHIILLSAGRLNQELKLWIPDNTDGYFPQSGPVHWKCSQTVQFKSSSESKSEDVFFNQVLVLPRVHMIVLANARRSALYVMHVNFGLSPTGTQLDYLAEFSVLFPILSFTATCDNVYDGHGIAQVYCIHAPSIQLYSLDLSQCIPPIEENYESLSEGLGLDKYPSSGSPILAHDVIQHGQSSGSISVVPSSNKVLEARDIAMVGTLELASTSDTKESIGSSAEQLLELTGKNLESLAPDGIISKFSAPLPATRNAHLNKEGSTPSNEDVRATQSAVMIEKTGYLYAHDESQQSGEKKIGGMSIPSSPNKVTSNHLSVSPKLPFSDTSHNESTISILQGSSALSSHLVTPSELMSMVAMSRAEIVGSSMYSSHSDVLSKERMKLNEKSEDLTKMGSEPLVVEAEETAEETSFPEEAKVISAQSLGVEPDFENTEVHNTCFDSSLNVADEELDLVNQQIVDRPIGGDSQFRDEEDDDEEEEDDDDDEILGQKQPLPRTSEDETCSYNVASTPMSVVLPARKKKNKNKAVSNAPTSTEFSSSAPTSTVFSPLASTSEQDSENLAIYSTGRLSEQLIAMQDSLSQLLVLQKEIQEQMATMLSIPIVKEVKRVESVLGQRTEKVLKAHMNAMWARLQEGNAKLEKIEKNRVQQLSSFLSNSLNKDLPVLVERAMKKEFATVGPSVARIVAPGIDKTISSAVTEAFQKGINGKGVAQLEKTLSTKLEASLSSQLQTQFEVSGKPMLQNTLSSCLEGSIIPSFERACQTMFGQVDAAFQKGLSEQVHAQQQLSASSVSLATILQDAVASTTSVAVSLKDELVDGQRKLLATIENTGMSRGVYTMNANLPEKAVTVQHIEESLDPTKELARLIAERKFEEAFNKALALTNVGIVSWLCNQVELGTLLTTTPPPLSQGLLLALVLQLGCDLGNDTGKKLAWIKDAALALNPHEPGLPPHVVRHYLEQLYTNLHALLARSHMTVDLVHATRLVIHVVNSLLTAYK